MEQTLNIVKRSLANLDRLEAMGVPVGLLRAELSTAAERLEDEIRAADDDGRAKCEQCGRPFHCGDTAASVMVRDSDGEMRNGYLCMDCVQVNVENLKRNVNAMVDKFGLKAIMVHASLESEVRQ